MRYWLLVLAASAFLVGCGSDSPVNDPFDDPFIGGTGGLAISFMDNAPPDQIYDDGQMPFSINVLVENLGESAVGPDAYRSSTSDRSRNTFAQIDLVGFNPAHFNNPETSKTFAQSGVTLSGIRRGVKGEIVPGGRNIITFENFNYQPDERGNSQLQIRGNICYDYTTYARGRVCIKDRVLESEDVSICDVSGVKTIKNSAAPLHVVSLTQTPLGQDSISQTGRIQTTFEIRNLGPGLVFRPGGGAYNGQPCDTSTLNNNKNYVHVTVYLGDDYSTNRIQCPLLGNSNEGDVQLFQGDSVRLDCIILTQTSQSRVYTDNLYVDLEYSYLEHIDKTVSVKDTGISR